ncbi:MAG TPA: nucleotide-binding protein [Candidatus Avalokitesvara rifleensis]|uniref:nucleotide-binding protein n=1 Tax=Candidatus Avalokitesvara rifleensis TaxID=3367620 RepID=UPI002712AC0A|nr:AAA family ATPase [Candidatus Brocadiales bacterium]
MAFTIALAGKGGTGKTTVAALTIRYIVEQLEQSVFGVDADPNASLGAALGAECEQTISDIREDVIEKKLDFPAGMSKERYIEYCIEDCLIENSKYDLLVMGRPEGPGCYCYVNNLLRKYLDRMGKDYPFVVVDNEAGMEHLSRRTTNRVDLMLLVCEPTVIGAVTAERITKLSQKLPITIKEKALLLNKVPEEGVDEKIKGRLEKENLKPELLLGFDPEILRASSNGTSLFDISNDNPTYRALSKFLKERLPVMAASK